MLSVFTEEPDWSEEVPSQGSSRVVPLREDVSDAELTRAAQGWWDLESSAQKS